MFVKRQTLYTFKHQLDNLKYSFSFIKYSCFERQSEHKDVNVIKSLTWILLLQWSQCFNTIFTSLNLFVGLK